MNQNNQQYQGKQPKNYPNEKKSHISIKFSVGRVLCFIILIFVFFFIRYGYFISLAKRMPEYVNYESNPSEKNKKKYRAAVEKFEKDYRKSALISWLACLVIPALICFLGRKDKKGFYQNPSHSPTYPPRY
ncbi:hypothetical protein PA0130 [Candidatus Phytoplasma australiense]|uniref:Transmembrane protein n=1 Tax=Phytoplasma australiense TaxID=59748 RepID=B1V933_PHYAS|nr:hypothetical protein PA0130 [Candidatus Phytoplasma australiense]